MEITLKEIIDLAVSIVWVPIVVDYYNTFLTNKGKNGKLISSIAWGLYWLCDNLFIQNVVDSMLERAIVSIVLWAAIGVIFYQNKLKTVMLVTASFYCITAIAESIVGFLTILFGIQLNDYVLSAWIISKIILVMIIQIIKINHKGKMSGEVTLSYWLMSLLIPIGSMLIIYIITELNMQLVSVHFSVMSSLALLITLLLNIFIFSVYDKLQKEAVIRQNNIMYEQQAKMYKLQSEEREAAWLESRKLHHDFKNHLVCLNGFNQEQHYEEMRDYLRGLIDDYTLNYWKNKSGNMIIDSLLGYKMSKAENDNITLSSEFMVPNHMPFEDGDLCVVMGNALDNAIEAVRNLDEEHRSIDLKMKFERNVLTIKLSNPYLGEIKSNAEGKLLTIKLDKNRHGIGLASIEEAVKRYDGMMKIETKDYMFKLMIAMYGKEELYVNQND